MQELSSIGTIKVTFIALLLIYLTRTITINTSTGFHVDYTPNRIDQKRHTLDGVIPHLSAQSNFNKMISPNISRQQLFSLNMMVKNRLGLEQRQESATPTAGGMTLYVKAGPDGKSLGDCPFAHYVRMVLEVKGLEYELVPSIQDTKPSWLIEYYDGKMPALRHRKECYVESDTIAAYLEFFFPKPELNPPNESEADAATTAIDGLFPSLAQYLKHIPDGDDVDAEKKAKLYAALKKLNDHLSLPSRTGPYLTGDGIVIRMSDCKLAPILYHMFNAVPAYKGDDVFVTLMKDFPFVKLYADHMFTVDASFQKTLYPPETLIWGWGNARK